MPSMPTLSAPKVPGLLKGLKVTLKTMLTPAVTQQYPHEKPDLAPRTRGVIALMEENCTVCMLCGRECPDWCIYIESHKERVPPAKPGGRERTRNQLDRFAIDFALCMYCGICVEVCPFDALFWSPEFEYSTYTIAELTHEQGRLREWMDTVPPPPPLEEGAEQPQEIAKALQAVEQQRQEALEEQAKRAQHAAAADQQQVEARGPSEEEEIEVEAQVDQETYDKLIEEGKSERVARARAKAAYVRREKARIRKEREEQAAQEPERPTATQDASDATSPAGAGAAGSPAGAGAAGSQDVAPEVSEPEPVPQEAEEIHVEGGEIDQETYDGLIEEGKSERVARARAKAAWVRKEKARIRKQREEGGGA